MNAATTRSRGSDRARFGRLVGIALGAAMLVGCNSQPQRDPEFSAALPPPLPVKPQGDGSIYAAGFERTWFETVRARRVGDILLINLVEDTEASHSNSGTVNRQNTTSITDPTLMGSTLKFGLPGQDGQFNLQQSLQSSTAFSGDADNVQNNEFSGSISVTVVEVLSNGYLRVRGEKRISMTGGNEYIRVSGIVRPDDINPANEVDSTRVADATLVYVGDGQHADATKMGWLARFFISAVWPF